MTRKIVVAKIKKEDLKTVGSAIETELRKLPYEGNTWYFQGTYHIQGRKQIDFFVQSMSSLIEECKKVFTDEESVQEFSADMEFLQGLLQIKAS